MPSSSETTAQVARETERRGKLAAPALGGGLLYLLSGIIIAATVNGAPSVGLFQGLAPALRGEARPALSPRAAEVKFFSHHAFALIAGSVLVAVAIGALGLIPLPLFDATRFRRPETRSGARPLVLAGGAAPPLGCLRHPDGAAVQNHHLPAGHRFS